MKGRENQLNSTVLYSKNPMTKMRYYLWLGFIIIIIIASS